MIDDQNLHCTCLKVSNFSHQRERERGCQLVDRSGREGGEKKGEGERLRERERGREEEGGKLN